ncbi:hypothetical protein AWB67_03092 [Caballeronia terrestris]|jgi:hypothetical protein|uniref:Uncharacterized protein n=1 Tax=Caballeronia terrestris TaxID=1226301 RepID=A0A158IZI8_9BURK|nr:hypothetical protein [Caballeronia terrestris]SAL61673.1 hypothetical protein AWB67_03092 [Caballeronia terrestris]
MRKVDRNRTTHQLARRTYSLTPKRGPVLLLGGIAAACAISAIAAAGFALVSSREYSRQVDAICAPPLSEQDLRDELTHARLALDHEAATRAALQKQAEGTEAELIKLRTDLAFFKRQRDKSD